MSREPEVVISDYPNVTDRVLLLGLQIPSQIAVLPRNFDTANNRGELLHEGEAPTLRKLLKSANIIETPIELPNELIPQISEHAYQEWIAPILFFSFSSMTQNPTLLNLALGVIANYLTDLFKGLSTHRGVILDIVVETKNGSCRKVHYRGSVDGLSAVDDIVKRIVKDG